MTPSTGACFLVALTLGATLPPGRPLSQDAEMRARKALEKAERHLARGSYEKAFDEYGRIAERYAGTEAGERARSRTRVNGYLGSVDLQRSGPSRNRLDLLVLGEGYPLETQKAFAKAVDGLPKLLAREPLFEEYAGYLNIVRTHLVSAEAGVSGSGLTYSTALDARTLSDASSSVFVTVNAARVGALLDELPADDGLVLALVAAGGVGSATRGVATLGDLDPQRLMAGLGHALAGLASERGAATGLETLPSEGSPPNTSESDDPHAVPWAHWLEAGVDGLGVFEGALGRPRGAYRASAGECWMGDPGAEAFCAVCREALLLRIHDFVDPIDHCSPPGQPSGRLGVEDFALRGPGPYVFEVALLTPATHRLVLRWWVLPEAQVPSPSSVDDRADPRPRSLRGPLAPIPTASVQEHRPPKGHDRFELELDGLAPGLYRVVCRAEDDARVRGERAPWVLRDEAGLLESERGWWVRVD